MAYTNKQLLDFLKRRHPLYEAMAGHWSFLRETYEGGRAWFKAHIHKYIKEGDKEFADRVDRAYRFNHTREVVDLVVKYLFRMEASRKQDAPEAVAAFWARATRDGLPIREFMRKVATESSITGRQWVVVDSTQRAPAVNLKEEKEQGRQIYAYLIDPVNLLDAGYDEGGDLVWCLIREVVRDDVDPILGSGALSERFRLWTRTNSQLFSIAKGKGGKDTVIVEPAIEHGLGVVPVVNADSVLSSEKWVSPALIADVAYLDRAVANYLSNLDAIIQDQTFSQLAIPAQGITPGTDPYKQMLEMGTKRIFVYEGGEGGNAPFFLSPDVKQAQLILGVISKIINEIYHTVGLAGERTKEDNSQGIDNSSGVAKAYDFERVNGLLSAKADSLESVENRLVQIVRLYAGEGGAELERWVEYPDDFDARGLYDEFEIAARLLLIEAPDGVRRMQMEQVITKLFPQLKVDLLEKLKDELKDWPPELPDPAAGGTPGSSVKESGKQSMSAKLATQTK